MSDAEDIDRIPTHVTEVRRVSDLTAGVRRLTVAGGLERYRSAGPDSFVHVLLPPPGRTELTIGSDFSWTACFAMADDERPVGAYYTVRHHRPDDDEIDLDVVLHDDAGPASGWAAVAAPGDPVALWGPRTTYRPAEGTDDLLLLADDTGLPALCAIAESLTADQRARAIVEVADEGEEQAIDSAAAVEVTWLHRNGTPPGRFRGLVDAVHGLAPTSPEAYVWGGGESRLMTEIRKHVRRTWGLPREQVSLTPYWRHADSPVPSEDDDE